MADAWTVVIRTASGARVLVSSTEALAAEWREYGAVAFSTDNIDAIASVFPGARLETVRRLKQ